MLRFCDRLLVTGGCGFIGSAFIRYVQPLLSPNGRMINLDLMTYAATQENVRIAANDPRYRFIQGDIRNQELIEKILQEEKIDAIVHFAAETHVDRSIFSAKPFIEANILGTLSLLEAVRKFPSVHFHHISTDEVYGALSQTGAFQEKSPYKPNSPYAASKASSDHFVRSFAVTYGISMTISHCSNNYGPGQYPEKFIPLMILNCLNEKPLPVYGKGENIRDWLYVDDHIEGIWSILKNGRVGETYDLGGGFEYSNLELLHLIIEILAKMMGNDAEKYRGLIRFVQDRPGHDFRYAIDSSKIRKELGWKPKTVLVDGLEKTIGYYRDLVLRSDILIQGCAKS